MTATYPTTWAGTPTGIGPALPPSYSTDATEEVADFEAKREQALCDVHTLVDWLGGECLGKAAYDDQALSAITQRLRDERAIRADYLNARAISTENLLSLAMGLSSDPLVRIVAMDELSGRYLRDQNLPGELA